MCLASLLEQPEAIDAQASAEKLDAALSLYNEADEAIRYWVGRRNDAGHDVMRLLNVQGRFTSLTFSTETLPWRWYGIRGRHLSPSAKRELRRLEAMYE